MRKVSNETFHATGLYLFNFNHKLEEFRAHTWSWHSRQAGKHEESGVCLTVRVCVCVCYSHHSAGGDLGPSAGSCQRGPEGWGSLHSCGERSPSWFCVGGGGRGGGKLCKAFQHLGQRISQVDESRRFLLCLHTRYITLTRPETSSFHHVYPAGQGFSALHSSKQQLKKITASDFGTY